MCPALSGLVLPVGYVVRTSFRVCSHRGGCVCITVVLQSIILSDGMLDVGVILKLI